MNLIERAVARLTQDDTDTPADRAELPQEPVARAERTTTIERLAERIESAETASPASPAPPASPAAATVEAPARTAPGAVAPAALAPAPAPAPAALAAAPAALAPARRPSVPPADSGETLCLHLEGLRARGMVMPTGAPTQASQEFRIIKRPLLANAFGRNGQPPARNGKRIMVTSAFPGEGKSFCAINLAMSIAAERDHGVILVDADVARPSIPQELGVEVDIGLMDWLTDGSRDISRLVRSTNIDTLSLLPAGRPNEHATELLASEAMGRLLEQLSQRYPDCILIFDSPPLLVTTEARVLASYMGQIVMVVEAGKTPRSAVSEALETIGSHEIIGLVLNKADKIETSGYYQGYGYGAA
ncbi:MAG: tyrosine-protein kinase family protein [Burkholderiaceae bacterium]|nr:tyrosine-protein kinase family protein [Burkholderiaceae bacterium]